MSFRLELVLPSGAAPSSDAEAGPDQLMADALATIEDVAASAITPTGGGGGAAGSDVDSPHTPTKVAVTEELTPEQLEKVAEVRLMFLSQISSPEDTVSESSETRTRLSGRRRRYRRSSRLRWPRT